MLFFSKTNILIGNCENLLEENKSILGTIIAIGDCTKNAVNRHGIKKYVFGCPPNINNIRKMLCL